FQILGGGLPVGAIKVGEATVAADGTLLAPIRLPLDLGWAEGETEVSYQPVAGVRAQRYWPAGSYDDFTVKQAPNLADALNDAGESEVTLNLENTPLGDTTVAIAYPDGTTAGTTTVIVSPTGPLPDGFTIASDPPLYLHLETTATIGGPTLVCIEYDAAVISGPQPSLFHFDRALDEWVDITVPSDEGTVCGMTTSFSPFALGYPDPFDFSGFFNPVSMTAENIAKPGQAIPVKFSLNGNQGLEVVTSARFVTEGNATSLIGEAIDTTTAGGSGLTYDARADQYTYVWKTPKTLSLKTGRFELTLSDGTVHTFNVTFKK
ncbi:MAG: PxKF domain-containing protein, partial [Mycetocola sp.]